MLKVGTGLIAIVLVALWVGLANAAKGVRTDAEQRRDDRRGGTVGNSKINALTWSFLHEGASEGERHRLLFSAAANLAEFDTVDDLISAILTTPGLDTGLPQREVERQIQCGIKHTRKHNAP